MTSARMVVCASHTPGMLRDKTAEFGHAFRAGVVEAAARVAAFAPELGRRAGGTAA
jgi:2,3-dihydroxyphenylpropionate 1,2-dioxygenase